MKKEHTKFIAFSSQKGGVGKSTFTAIIASLLHYRLGYNVAVIDCDFPQYSLAQLRERDVKMVMENELYKKAAHKQFRAIRKKAFPVEKCKAEHALDEAFNLIEKSATPLDVVFFDLPGTVNSAGILNTLAGMHHIFSPVTADRLVLESTLIFTQVLKDIIMKQGQTAIKTVHLFWNAVDGREKTKLYEVYNQLIADLGLSIMDSFVTESKRFRKEAENDSKAIFRSTLLAPDRQMLKGSRLDIFTEEFLRITQLNKYETRQ